MLTGGGGFRGKVCKGHNGKKFEEIIMRKSWNTMLWLSCLNLWNSVYLFWGKEEERDNHRESDVPVNQ